MKNRKLIIVSHCPGKLSGFVTRLGLGRVAPLAVATIFVIASVGGVLADTESSRVSSITGSSARSISGSSARSISGSSARSISGSSARSISGSSARSSTYGPTSIEFVGPVTAIDVTLGTISVGDLTVYINAAGIYGSIGLGSIVLVDGAETTVTGFVIADSVSALIDDVEVGGSNLMSITGSSWR